MRLLQLGEDRVGARDGDAASGLLLGVDDLAVVDDDGVAAGAVRPSHPVDALAELAALVRGKDLVMYVSNSAFFSFFFVCVYRGGGDVKLTINSS